MGTYVNPGTMSMQKAVRSPIYVDKTGLLRHLNASINTENCYFAVSRARRFGKSQACGMIDAYYSRGCDSKELFSHYQIAQDPSFEEHLNKYNVLHFDVSSFYNAAKKPEDILPLMDSRLLQSMYHEFPFLEEFNPIDTSEALYLVYEETGVQFVIIIDEYDCIIRDSADDEDLILQYLKYLRSFFKTEESKQFLALGYITGILPVKKIEGESALNNFREYTMTSPGELLPFFGFTQQEVEQECVKRKEDIRIIREWYDGYYMYAPAADDQQEETGEEGADGSVRFVNDRAFKLWHIYNPNSVAEVLRRREFMSYWKNTGSFTGLQKLIRMNYAGLKDDIVHMLTGERRKVNITSFQNDLTHFKKKDDVLTCLIHMGYLGYDARTKETFIPNREVAEVFESAVGTSDWDDLSDALTNADELLRAVWNGEEEQVARVIAASQQNYASIIQMHDENSLALAIMVSFYTARKDYHVFRELPAGRGFADIVFIPKHEGEHPPMIVELKWNRSANTAIRQIKNNAYTGALTGCRDEILLIGINYTRRRPKGDAASGEKTAQPEPPGKYTCRIEKHRLLT